MPAAPRLGYPSLVTALMLPNATAFVPIQLALQRPRTILVFRNGVQHVQRERVLWNSGVLGCDGHASLLQLRDGSRNRINLKWAGDPCYIRARKEASCLTPEGLRLP